ncbi:N-acetyltransferase [Actinorhabdospora filicis]|uniref:N-acetyltransferase n=1 Tax=Actinorhabdospora filicis TaxID=1785913 RepID=A0A9W6SNB9_9ACTN|nr:GNAT family N-acetyltransferase [Actinorhabdospora filicis]GLZ79081.1 N-acetyltransferase [Actinorhabdospora filicis]
MTLRLRTERLDLRPFAATDLDEVHAYRRLPEVAAYLYTPVLSREQVAERLTERAGWTTLAGSGGVNLAVVLRDKDAVIGEVNLVWYSEDNRAAELGYVFHPAFAGHGYASEAAAEILRYAFEEAGLHRVVGRCDAENTASWRLMERLGMRREAHFVRNEIMPYSKDRDDPYVSELIYAMLGDEWRARA